MFDFIFALLIFLLLVLIAALIAAVTQGVAAVKLPIKEMLSLKKHPVGSLPREEAQDRVSKLARSAASLCNFMMWANVFSLVAVGIFVVFAFSVGGGTPDYEMLGSFFLGDSQSSGMLQILVVVAFCIPMFKLLRSFFRAIGQTGRPFDVERARELAQVGTLLVWMGIAVFLTGGIELLAFGDALQTAAQGSHGTNVYAADVFLLGAFMFIFARIFEYGCILQQEDDGIV